MITINQPGRPPLGQQGEAGAAGVAGWFARRGIHYGWVMVAITLTLVLITAGVRSAPGVLIRPLEQDFGWSRGQISLALSLSLLTYGFGGPLSGKLVERFGIRVTALAFLAVTATGMVLSPFVAQLWQLHLIWGIVIGIGTGGMALVMGAAVANIWFDSRRGLVTGLLGGGSSAGQLIFVPVLVWVTSQWHWRAALVLLAALVVGLLLPAVLLFLRSRPRDVGLTPYGAATGGGPAMVDTRVTPISAAIRTGDFWLLALSFSVCGFTTIGLIGTHFIPHAVEHGFSQGQAAGILSVLGGMNVVGTIASGYLCDRYPPRLLLAGYYTLRALSLLALPLLSTMGSVPVMSVFAVVFGFDYIATVPPTVMMTAERFGRRSVPSIYGWITFAHMAGGAVAAALAGSIHDWAGDYTPAFYLAGVLALVAAAMAFGVRRPTPAPMMVGAAGD